ncbi:MAG: RNA polymerase sigma-70 factor [Cyclonatronaceae bacterium]
MSTDTEYQYWAGRIRDSDEEAFSDLFRESYEPLMRYAYSFVKDADVAGDMLQEVYAHLWDIRNRLDERKSLKALLYRMTKNRCINYIRSRKSVRLDEVPLSDQPRVEMKTETDKQEAGSQLERQLGEWIEELPPRQREAFELSRFEGLDHHEIATVMECAPRTVNNHIVGALNTLRKRLHDWETERNN